MNLLALDIATKTGWCTKTTFGCWDLSSKRDESKGMRLIRFKAKLIEICDLEQIDIIVVERVAGLYKNSIIVASEFHGVFKLFCEESDIEYRAYSAGEIKKYATDKGNCNKKAMIEAAKEKYGYEGNNDNEADAIHLYHLAKEDLKIN